MAAAKTLTIRWTKVDKVGSYSRAVGVVMRGKTYTSHLFRAMGSPPFHRNAYPWILEFDGRFIDRFRIFEDAKDASRVWLKRCGVAHIAQQRCIIHEDCNDNLELGIACLAEAMAPFHGQFGVWRI